MEERGIKHKLLDQCCSRFGDALVVLHRIVFMCV